VVFGDFEWDAAKAAANARKHRVTFEEAATVFDDPAAVDAPDVLDSSRFVIIGCSAFARCCSSCMPREASGSASSARATLRRHNGKCMKKKTATKRARPSETSLERYDWSKARRGRWAGKLGTPRVAFIRPELWEHFGSNEAINEALEALVRLGEAVAPRRRRVD